MNKDDQNLILQNNESFINDFFSKIYNRPMLLSNQVKKMYNEIGKGHSYELTCELLKIIEKSFYYRAPKFIKNKIEDAQIFWKQFGKRYVIDKSPKESDYLALACIIKNEAPYIREFIQFYLMMGVDRIYLFDNDSDDDIWNKIEDYVQCGKVVYIYYPGKKVQYAAYRYAVRYCKHYTRWLMLLDADEFLFSPKSHNLSTILRQYEKFPAVGVNWVLFGPSGHETKPSGSVIENYTETFEDENHIYNRRIKSIVNPKKVESITSPHFCIYKGGEFAVDEEMNMIDGTAAYIKDYGYAFTHQNHRSKLRINHYITKSKEELRTKCQRGYPDGAVNPNYEISLARFDVPLMKDYQIVEFMKEINERKIGE